MVRRILLHFHVGFADLIGKLGNCRVEDHGVAFKWCVCFWITLLITLTYCDDTPSREVVWFINRSHPLIPADNIPE